MVGECYCTLSEQDIIEFNQLVQNYKNDITNTLDVDSGDVDMDNKHHKDNKLDKRGFWRSLIDDLNKYGGLKIAIKEQSEKIERIKQEALRCHKQKQGAMAYCHLAVALAGIINHKIAHLNGLMDHYFKKHTQNQMKMFTPSLSPILVFVICGNSDKKGKGEEGEKQN